MNDKPKREPSPVPLPCYFFSLHTYEYEVEDLSNHCDIGDVFKREDVERLFAESQAAVRTLQFLGYTYHGGEQWKPPLGKRPAWLDSQPQPQASANKPTAEWLHEKHIEWIREDTEEPFVDFLHRTWPEAPKPQAEPVAWFVDYPDEMRLGRFFTTGPVAGARNTPLYAAPQPQVSAEDVALVDEVMSFAVWAGGHREAWQRLRAKILAQVEASEREKAGGPQRCLK